jgi:molybdopterin converting factor small subunit
MRPSINIVLYGSLKKQFGRVNREWIEHSLDQAMRVTDIIERLAIPIDRIQMVMVNHRAVGKDAMVQPGDRIALFPGEYPFFADWNAYRFI